MKILVCAKQVMENETVVEIDDSERWYRPAHSPRFQMNSFDEYAVEAAVAIKSEHTDTIVDVLTVGPERADAILERAVGMGADRGVRLADNESGYIGPYHTANCIAAYAKDSDYDLILTGVMAEDDMQGLAGPMIAAILDWPVATSVISIQSPLENGWMRVEREIEGGFREELELLLPAVVAVQSGINRPRYPTLSKLLKAKKEKPEIIEADSLFNRVSTEEVTLVGYPVRSRAGVLLGGSTAEKAKELCRILSERALM